jgi:hypothetical protein
MKPWIPLTIIALSLGISACEKTMSQKVEDKAEDASHNVGQAAERAGEKVND